MAIPEFASGCEYLTKGRERLGTQHGIDEDIFFTDTSQCVDHESRIVNGRIKNAQLPK